MEFRAQESHRSLADQCGSRRGKRRHDRLTRLHWSVISMVRGSRGLCYVAHEMMWRARRVRYGRGVRYGRLMAAPCEIVGAARGLGRLEQLHR